MQVGSLGSITFEVSSSKLRTFSEISERTSARIHLHEPALAAPIAEWMGDGAHEITLPVTLSRSLGVDPEADIEQLMSDKSAGRLMALTIGGTLQGGSGALWLIGSLDVSHRHFDARGGTVTADVSIGLTLARTAATPAPLATTVPKASVERVRE